MGKDAMNMKRDDVVLCAAVAFVVAVGVLFGAEIGATVAHKEDEHLMTARAETMWETEEATTEATTEEIKEETMAVKHAGERIRVTATAYCPCSKCCGKYGTNRPTDVNGETIVYTASGAVARSKHTIAVDPRIIPYGTIVEYNGVEYVAEDTGVDGNRIDIYFDSHAEALQFGKRQIEVHIKEVRA